MVSKNKLQLMPSKDFTAKSGYNLLKISGLAKRRVTSKPSTKCFLGPVIPIFNCKANGLVGKVRLNNANTIYRFSFKTLNRQ